jgi:hypothetical protein
MPASSSATPTGIYVYFEKERARRSAVRAAVA